MELIATDIKDVVIIKPRIFNDSRGYFFESYSKRTFDDLIGPVKFVQDNESMSSKGVVRGLHFQYPPYAQSKLVRCVKGNVLDIAVDIRKGSPTFRKVLLMDLQCCLTWRFFSISATTFIRRKLTEAYISLTTPLT